MDRRVGDEVGEEGNGPAGSGEGGGGGGEPDKSPVTRRPSSPTSLLLPPPSTPPPTTTTATGFVIDDCSAVEQPDNEVDRPPPSVVVECDIDDDTAASASVYYSGYHSEELDEDLEDLEEEQEDEEDDDDEVVEEEEEEEEEEEGQDQEEVEEEEEEDDGLPYPGFVPITLGFLTQYSKPRTFCLRMITNPYPFLLNIKFSGNFARVTESAVCGLSGVSLTLSSRIDSLSLPCPATYVVYMWHVRQSEETWPTPQVSRRASTISSCLFGRLFSCRCVAGNCWVAWPRCQRPTFFFFVCSRRSVYNLYWT